MKKSKKTLIIVLILALAIGAAAYFKVGESYKGKTKRTIDDLSIIPHVTTDLPTTYEKSYEDTWPEELRASYPDLKAQIAELTKDLAASNTITIPAKTLVNLANYYQLDIQEPDGIMIYDVDGETFSNSYYKKADGGYYLTTEEQNGLAATLIIIAYTEPGQIVDMLARYSLNEVNVQYAINIATNKNNWWEVDFKAPR